MIRSVLVMMLMIATISINFNVLLPVLASRTLNSGPEIFGILSALFGFGALVGALFSASLGRASRHTMLIGAALFSLSEIALAPLHVAWAAGLALVVTGIAFTLYSSQANATPPARGDRIRCADACSASTGTSSSAPPQWAVSSPGWLAEIGGTQLAFLVAGVVGVAATTYGWADTAPRRQSNDAAHRSGGIGEPASLILPVGATVGSGGTGRGASRAGDAGVGGFRAGARLHGHVGLLRHRRGAR